jgi:hypothetical protein
MKERRPSGEPVLAEVGPPAILSLDVAGYRSVRRLPLLGACRVVGGVGFNQGLCLSRGASCAGR